MGRPIDISDETTPLSGERPRRQKRYHRRQKFIKKFLFIALVLAVIFAIFHPLFNRKKVSELLSSIRSFWLLYFQILPTHSQTLLLAVKPLSDSRT
jgi:hypothetical protein